MRSRVLGLRTASRSVRGPLISSFSQETLRLIGSIANINFDLAVFAVEMYSQKWNFGWLTFTDLVLV